ncbi:unnamed protein product [Sympodiomycopsis kandeliae]
MKLLLPFLVLVTYVSTLAHAFPSYARSEGADYSLFLKKAAEIKAGKGEHADLIRRAVEGNAGNGTSKDGFGQRRLTALLNPANFKFNDKEQTVDLTSDEHKFIAPGPNDIRGPCPGKFAFVNAPCNLLLIDWKLSTLNTGLNLLANHGYLDRSGVTNLFQGIDAINKVFGVEYDLALALNAYAVVFNGNLLDLSWSIGGPAASKGLGKITELLFGKPSGINAHNIYEGDASIVRRDYYAPGANRDNVELHMPYFKDLLELGGNDRTPGKDIYNAELMLQHKFNRWNESVSTNPFFFNSAFGGLVVTTAAERFVAEFAANNTADENGYNRIYLDEPNLLAFFSVKRNADDSLTYTPGHERLLPSWKRRPLASTFGLDDIVLTLLNAASVNPHLLSVGGNTGAVNTFTGVDVGDLTGGVFHAAELLSDPQGLACYLFQVGIEELVPTQLNIIYKVTADALDFVGKNLKTPFKKLATAGGNPCERVHNASVVEAYDKYPGSKISREGQGDGLLGSLLKGVGL